jgi:hypothetical protein
MVPQCLIVKMLNSLRCSRVEDGGWTVISVNDKRQVDPVMCRYVGLKDARGAKVIETIGETTIALLYRQPWVSTRAGISKRTVISLKPPGKKLENQPENFRDEGA